MTKVFTYGRIEYFVTAGSLDSIHHSCCAFRPYGFVACSVESPDGNILEQFCGGKDGRAAERNSSRKKIWIASEYFPCSATAHGDAADIDLVFVNSVFVYKFVEQCFCRLHTNGVDNIFELAFARFKTAYRAVPDVYAGSTGAGCDPFILIYRAVADSLRSKDDAIIHSRKFIQKQIASENLKLCFIISTAFAVTVQEVNKGVSFSARFVIGGVICTVGKFHTISVF